MQNTPVKLLDVVALLEDKPAEGLVAGQVGTVVEVFAPGVFEVEFLDASGRRLVLVELKRAELLALKHEAAARRSRNQSDTNFNAETQRGGAPTVRRKTESWGGEMASNDSTAWYCG